MITNTNISKTVPAQTNFDKENNARNANITSQGDRNNFYARKVKKLQEISNKASNALFENIETVRAVNSLTALTTKPLNTRVQDDIEISRKLNVNRVKKMLNYDDGGELSTMCDESNYSSVYSVTSVSNKPQDDKMSLEKDKTSAMQIEKERKHSLVDVSNNNKMIDEDNTKLIVPKFSPCDKEPSEEGYQNQLLEKYASCILRTFKEKDVSLKLSYLV